jgi:hypothetical protein
MTWCACIFFTFFSLSSFYDYLHVFSWTDILLYRSPEFIQDSLCDVSEGRIVASVTKVQDAGHMVSILSISVLLHLPSAP